MVKCDTCLNFNGIHCLEPNGVKYRDIVIDPLEEINCSAYLEKALAGLFGLGGFF